MEDSWIRARHLSFPNHGEAHTFVLIKVLTALQLSLHVTGNFRKREKNVDYWIEYFPSGNFFQRKVADVDSRPIMTKDRD